jgi:hypothetical protein
MAQNIPHGSTTAPDLIVYGDLGALRPSSVTIDWNDTASCARSMI